MNCLFLRLGALGCLVLCASSSFAASQTLVDHGDGWLYRKGTNAPQTDWKTAPDGALDATWLGPSPGGFGYGDGDDATVLIDMLNRYTTVYTRRTFVISEALDDAQDLRLTVDYDDGFVAYLDGIEIARALAPGNVGTEPPANATATTTHAASIEGGAPWDGTLAISPASLSLGTHVLAVIGLNQDLSSSDLSLIVDLVVEDAPLPPLVDHAQPWHYRKGTSPPPAGWQTLPVASLGPDWLTGSGGLGYDDGDDTTVLDDMYLGYTTLYVRQNFVVSETLAEGLNVLLVMDWDDGFVAYLDGVEVARAVAPGLPNVEPPYNATATTTREASAGSGGNPPQTFDLGAAAQRLPPGEHILAILGLNQALNSSDFSLIADLILGEAPPPDPGLIDADTTWAAAGGPYVIDNDITVAPGVTLTIEPGVTVLFNQGRRMRIEGRLLAQGTIEDRILFTRNSGATSWDQIELDSSPFESILAHADVRFATGSGNIEATGTRLYLEDVIWSDTDSQLLDVTSTSILVRNCVFPSIGSEELLHFSNMPANGYARIEGCVFGGPSGYNDVIDFTGGNRPGPIGEFLNNTFLAAVDECFDMDGTDAHIEGNIFFNVRQDTTRSSSSNAISTGAGSGQTSELVVVRNFFYNCDHAMLLKDFGSALFQNNTVVGIRANPPASQPPAFINFGEPNRDVPGGAGALLDGNIIWELEGEAFLNFTNGVMFLTVDRSILQDTVWPGVGNATNDPMFVSLEGINTDNLKEKLALAPGSPAIGTGPNGLDKGALVAAGASISGEPEGVTTNSNATLIVAGPGIYAYRWKLNDGLWSEEVALTNSLFIRPDLFDDATPIVLTNLPDGTHTVYVVGKNSAGTWQSMDDPTASRSWTVAANGLLEILEVAHDGSVFSLTFSAQAGHSHLVQYRDSLDQGDWLPLTNVPASAVTGPMTVYDAVAGVTSRCYRVVTPGEP